MMYTQKEIEQKRLLALQRKQQRQLNNLSNVNKTKSTSSDACGKGNSVIQGNTSKGNENLQKVKPKTWSSGNRYDPIKSKKFYGTLCNITAKCYMISQTRFTVEFSSFCQPVIDSIKYVNSCKWDFTTKNWNFHLNDYENVLKRIAEHNNVTVSGIPKYVLQTFRKQLEKKADVQIDLSKVDEHLMKVVAPFQIEGIRFGISKHGRCIIADDMGLGKTLQALGIAHYYQENWPLLIVTPSSVRYQWSEAINTYLPSLPLQYVRHIRNTKDCITSDKITIVSYDVLTRRINDFDKHVFGVVILDESHFLKSFKASRTKSVIRITSKANQIILLSGTPALSRPVELFTQITLVVKNFMNFHDYGIRYCAGERTAFAWNFNGSSNMQELQELLKVLCLIRRLKSEVLTQLPPKLRKVVILDPDFIKAGTKEMKQASKYLKNNLSSREEHAALLQYYNQTSVAKCQAVCKYINDVLESENKFLVFAHHKNMIGAICEELQRRNVGFIKIDGETNAEQRKERVDSFQKNNNVLVAVLSITAANAGINLTAAHLVIFAELFWNPGILCQAEDRVHRIGQQDRVMIEYLIAQNTADDHLWPLIQKKMDVLNQAGLNQDFELKDVNIQKQKAAITQSNNDSHNSAQNKQSTLDSFYTKSPILLKKHDCNVIQNTKQGLDKPEVLRELLDQNDEDFESIDLDSLIVENIVKS